MAKITAVYAGEGGKVFGAAGMAGAACLGDSVVRIREKELLPLPESADLMFLPERRAVGFDKNGTLRSLPGRAVAAILPVGYTRLLLPSFKRSHAAKTLPLFGYTAVALYKGTLCAAAIRTDKDDRWNPFLYNNTRALKKLIREMKKRFPENRLVTHLANCSLRWFCCTAQNLFYHRWEAGIPVSPVCNANCIGCISLQTSECCPSPQSRITFRPTADEISELALYHLSDAPDAIVSFGQGCEGEPSLSADTVSASIRLIRERTTRGQININTNGGFFDGVRKIVDAGLDSMRVSIISAREDSYNAYYRSGYSLDSVKNSIRYALSHGVYVSLNLLTFPGFNDREEEFRAWKAFFGEFPVRMVQVRNLNIDPDVFLTKMPRRTGELMGVDVCLRELRRSFPAVSIGSFSHFVK